MKTVVPLLLLPSLVWAAGLPAPKLVFQPLQIRTGFDTNPVGSGGSADAVWGGTDTFVFAAGAGFSLLVPAAQPDAPARKIGYAGEWTRFDRRSGEDFTTHRFSLSLPFSAGDWKVLAEGSSLFVAGSTDTLPSLGNVNANAVALWRERRRQWQHRLRLQAGTENATTLWRASGTLLACDYRTAAVAGKVAFADRADAQLALDFGWKQQPRSTWVTGLRSGRQFQDTVPLPGGDFDYGNTYHRLVIGWEGRLPAGTSLSIAAGPDFRRYTGTIDPTVFTGGRNRTSLWTEAGLTSKPHPDWSVSAKLTRFVWLSSTGKSAYYDTSAEAAATWSPRPGWSLRAQAKIHRCDYLPVRRDDWESLLGLGASRNLSARTQVGVDVLHHRGWNTLPATAERAFNRLLVQFATTITL